MRLKIVLNKIKQFFINFANKVSNLFNNTLEFITLKEQIKILSKELEESKSKEKPYIDKINRLKSENRVFKILNTKLEKKVKNLQEENERLEKNQNTLFKEV
jgi:chromosome segregation ATPase